MYESIVNSKYVCHQKNCRLDLSQKVRCLTYLKISCAKKTDAFGSTTIEKTTTRRF